jgi:hypothetical protein
MSFVRIRTIKGRRYRYKETRWREGGKVRSRSESLGPADGWTNVYGTDGDPFARAEMHRADLRDAAHAARVANLFSDIGLSVPAGTGLVEKPVSTVDLNVSEKEASPEGEADISGTPDQALSSRP